MGDKLGSRYHGPFSIIEILGKGVYRLTDETGPIKQTANAANLKPWREREQPDEQKSPLKITQEDDEDQKLTLKMTDIEEEDQDLKPPPLKKKMKYLDKGSSCKIKAAMKKGVKNTEILAEINASVVKEGDDLKALPEINVVLDKVASGQYVWPMVKESVENETDNQKKSPKLKLSTEGPVMSTTKKEESVSECSTSYWVRELHLIIEDRDIIRDPTGWLNDRIIDAVNVLTARHMGANANQTVNLVQTPTGFKSANDNSVMIIHDKDHWICSACLDNEVFYLDSLRRNISPVVAMQLRQLYKRCLSKDKELKVSVVPCALQTNGSDCGVYASAFAFEIAVNGKGGISYVGNGYDMKTMRQHLETALELRILSTFSQMNVRKRGRKQVIRVVTI